MGLLIVLGLVISLAVAYVAFGFLVRSWVK